MARKNARKKKAPGAATPEANKKSPDAGQGNGAQSPAQVELVVFTKEGGPLTKRISLNADGTVNSDGGACTMARGQAQRVQVAGVEGLAKLIENLRSEQAIALGALRADLPDDVAVVTEAQLNGQPATIARTADNIVYVAGRPAYALHDHDTKGMPEAIAARIVELGGFWPALVSVLPGLEGAARVERRSTSAGLVHAETGAELPGSGGMHVFILARDSSDIERYLKALHQRCWLAGFGWMRVGGAGQLLERSIVDYMVGAPERLVFEGPPILDPPVKQDAASRLPVVTPGTVVNTSAVCQDLTQADKKAFNALRKAEKQRLEPECEKKRAAYITRRTDELVAKGGISRAQATQQINSLCNGVLLGDFVLPFDDPTLADITVAAVLADPTRYEHCTLADPIEGISYGRNKAKVFLREGVPWIHSFAHGRTDYRLVPATDDEEALLAEMNAQHCVLPIGGKTRVATWGDDPKFPGYKIIVGLSSPNDFKALHNKYRHLHYDQAKGKIVVVKNGDWWVDHPRRRQYDGGMQFMPTHDPEIFDTTLNLWRGFAIKARKPEGKSGAAGCQLFLNHGLKVICSGNAEHYDYLIKREAFIAQRRTRSEIAVGLRTVAEGTGKGFWCRTLNHLYGAHAMQVQNPAHVIGKHNPHLERLLRLVADEALFAESKRHRDALYHLITEPELTIEPKFVDVYKADNHLNIDITSNAEHFLAVSGTARRFFVPTVSSEHASDGKYFEAITAQLEDGGYAALLWHLLHEVDIRDFNIRAVPKTAALAEQAAYSRKGVDLLVETACNEGRVPCVHLQHPDVSVTTGHDSREPGFDHFISRHSDRDLARLGPIKVKGQLRREWGCITGRDARITGTGGKRVNGIVWPPLPDLRKRFQDKHGAQDWLCPEFEAWQPHPDCPL
jgi:hypothetical protein